MCSQHISFVHSAQHLIPLAYKQHDRPAPERSEARRICSRTADDEPGGDAAEDLQQIDQAERQRDRRRTCSGADRPAARV